MGSFYVNFAVKGGDQRNVAATLERNQRVAVVTPSQKGYVVVYDQEADRQAIKPILDLGGLLSSETACPVFATLNHDDDVLCYWLFERGKLIDAYNSNPDAFEPGKDAPPWQDGDAKRVCAALSATGDPVRVEEILRGEYVFAVERHGQLAKVLGLPSCSVGFGYEYVARGELEDVDASELVFIGRPGLTNG